jgi:RHS repeat-associated protein
VQRFAAPHAGRAERLQQGPAPQAQGRGHVRLRQDGFHFRFRERVPREALFRLGQPQRARDSAPARAGPRACAGVLTIYDATWSNVRSVSNYANAYTYTGRQLDAETGLYYYTHRSYHSQLGRFGSRDPAGFECLALNMLSYVGSKPTDRGDSLGLAWYHHVPIIGTLIYCSQ